MFDLAYLWQNGAAQMNSGEVISNILSPPLIFPSCLQQRGSSGRKRGPKKRREEEEPPLLRCCWLRACTWCQPVVCPLMCVFCCVRDRVDNVCVFGGAGLQSIPPSFTLTLLVRAPPPPKSVPPFGKIAKLCCFDQVQATLGSASPEQPRPMALASYGLRGSTRGHRQWRIAIGGCHHSTVAGGGGGWRGCGKVGMCRKEEAVEH